MHPKKRLGLFLATLTYKELLLSTRGSVHLMCVFEGCQICTAEQGFVNTCRVKLTRRDPGAVHRAAQRRKVHGEVPVLQRGLLYNS